MYTIRTYGLLLLTLCIVVASTLPVQAQGPVDSTDINSYDLSLTDLGYSDTVLVEREAGYFQLYLPRALAPGQGQSYFDLVISHNMAQIEQTPILSIAFNDETLANFPLTKENAERGQIRLALKGESLRPGVNRLKLSFDAGTLCGMVRQFPLSMLVHGDSVFHVEYSQTPPSPDLALYPAPFYELTFQPSEVYIVLPRRPTSTDFSAAATISAGLGRLSQGKSIISSTLDIHLPNYAQENKNLIVIGQPGTNTLLNQLNLPLLATDTEIPKHHGIIQEVPSPWNPYQMILVVTSQSEEGLLKAATALNREAHFLGMKGQTAIVEEILPPPTSPSVVQATDLSLAELGYEDEILYGVQPYSVRYYFDMPSFWKMAEQAKLVLSFNHSRFIQADFSTLSVHLNRVPLESVFLNDDNATNGLLEVDLPAWLLEPGRNRVDIAVEMALEGDVCNNWSNQQAWTVIRRDSYIHLAYVPQEVTPDLSLFPYPFDKNQNFDDLYFVLPETPNTGERQALVRLAALLGASKGGSHLAMRVVTADRADEKIKSGFNLVVIGRPTRNAFLVALNDALPQPFEVGTDLLQPVLDPLILTPDPNRSAGLIEELPSPWNSEHFILVITGTTDQGVELALDTLLHSRDQLGGNVAVVENDRLYSTDTRPFPSSAAKPEATVKLQQLNAERLIVLSERWW